MEMFLYTVLVFIFGIVTAKVYGSLISLGLSMLVIRNSLEASLKLLGNASVDMAYIKQLKHKAMIECGESEKNINAIRTINEEEFNRWKRRSIQNIKLCLSGKYEFMVDFNDWEQAMEKLNEFYKTKN
jgi:hypothetical protein|tara:strand:+ start:50472 stop:50855 length:384 start_codon:yes stop_codon:yes gene_type:complete